MAPRQATRSRWLGDVTATQTPGSEAQEVIAHSPHVLPVHSVASNASPLGWCSCPEL